LDLKVNHFQDSFDWFLSSKSDSQFGSETQWIKLQRHFHTLTPQLNPTIYAGSQDLTVLLWLITKTFLSASMLIFKEMTSCCGRPRSNILPLEKRFNSKQKCFILVLNYLFINLLWSIEDLQCHSQIFYLQPAGCSFMYRGVILDWLSNLIWD
jgi:hypothetical protein